MCVSLPLQMPSMRQTGVLQNTDQTLWGENHKVECVSILTGIEPTHHYMSEEGYTELSEVASWFNMHKGRIMKGNEYWRKGKTACFKNDSYFFFFFFYCEYDYISSFSERILEDFQPLQISQGFPFIYQLIFNIRHYYWLRLGCTSKHTQHYCLLPGVL